MKKTLTALLRAVIGLFVCAAGLYLTIQAHIGTGPWDTLCLGLSGRLGTGYGVMSVSIALVIVVIDFLMHESIGMGTLLDALLVGVFVDGLAALHPVPQGTTIWYGLVLLFAGMVLISVGQWLYMSAGLSCGPRDALMVGLGRLVPRVPIGVVNFALLVMVVGCGWLLGGPVGLGTLLYAVLQNVIMQGVFHLAHFEPRRIQQENLRQTIHHFTKKERCA